MDSCNNLDYIFKVNINNIDYIGLSNISPQDAFNKMIDIINDNDIKEYLKEEFIGIDINLEYRTSFQVCILEDKILKLSDTKNQILSNIEKHICF